MGQDFDFSVPDLGARTVRSPLAFSSAIGDSIANYVGDDDTIRWGTGPGAAAEGLLEKAGPRELIYFNPAHVHAGIVVTRRNRVDPEGSLYRDAIDATGQPVSMRNDEEARHA